MTPLPPTHPAMCPSSQLASQHGCVSCFPRMCPPAGPGETEEEECVWPGEERSKVDNFSLRHLPVNFSHEKNHEGFCLCPQVPSGRSSRQLCWLDPVSQTLGPHAKGLRGQLEEATVGCLPQEIAQTQELTGQQSPFYACVDIPSS